MSATSHRVGLTSKGQLALTELVDTKRLDSDNPTHRFLWSLGIEDRIDMGMLIDSHHPCTMTIVHNLLNKGWIEYM
jgi:hypothetical protein